MTDLTPDEKAELHRSIGFETPEEKIARLEAELVRVRDEKLIWKRRALQAKRSLDAHLQMCEVAS